MLERITAKHPKGPSPIVPRTAREWLMPLGEMVLAALVAPAAPAGEADSEACRPHDPAPRHH